MKFRRDGDYKLFMEVGYYYVSKDVTPMPHNSFRHFETAEGRTVSY